MQEPANQPESFENAGAQAAIRDLVEMAAQVTEAQIIGTIKEQEAGMPTAEVCRRHGLSAATFYKLKSKYGGMEVSEAARLKALDRAMSRHWPERQWRGRTPSSSACWPTRCSTMSS
ncbi:hypothetical protein GCM10008024_30620 [Allgaiera indica]|uniref:Transposase n=1 Tax=Allgaiera indica TaxID=765699 RepID=A0AAN4UTB3_9RHOB|nr:hypothetical protein GCM10008024_30620 [Allgaiera indica]